MSKKGDWGLFKEPSEVLKEQGVGALFLRHTLRHKVRLLIGVNGCLTNRYYFFVPTTNKPKLNYTLNTLVNLIPSI